MYHNMGLVIYICLISKLITISTSVTIIRGEIDQIKDVSEKFCFQLKGDYINGTCSCSELLPTFMSFLHQESFCVNHGFVDCVQVRYDNPIITTIPSCDNDTVRSIIIWNSKVYEGNEVFGEWIRVTSKAMPNFVERINARSFRLSINDGHTISNAHLVKINLQCDPKCYFLKMVGKATYPLKSNVYGALRLKKETANKSNGLRTGIIVLVIGVMSFIAAIFFTTIHAYRNNLFKCLQRNENNTSIEMDDVEMPLDTPQVNVVTPSHIIRLARKENPQPTANFYGGATSSEFTSLERLDNSQYSAISPSYSEASIKRGMENSSWENTPSQQRAAITERNRAGMIYQELLTLPPDRFTVSPRCTRSETHF